MGFLRAAPTFYIIGCGKRRRSLYDAELPPHAAGLCGWDGGDGAGVGRLLGGAAHRARARAGRSGRRQCPHRTRGRAERRGPHAHGRRGLRGERSEPHWHELRRLPRGRLARLRGALRAEHAHLPGRVRPGSRRARSDRRLGIRGDPTRGHRLLRRLAAHLRRCRERLRAQRRKRPLRRVPLVHHGSVGPRRTHGALQAERPHGIGAAGAPGPRPGVPGNAHRRGAGKQTRRLGSVVLRDHQRRRRGPHLLHGEPPLHRPLASHLRAHGMVGAAGRYAPHRRAYRQRRHGHGHGGRPSRARRGAGRCGGHGGMGARVQPPLPHVQLREAALRRRARAPGAAVRHRRRLAHRHVYGGPRAGGHVPSARLLPALPPRGHGLQLRP